MARQECDYLGSAKITHLFSTSAGGKGTSGNITLPQSIENFDFIYVTTGIDSNDTSIAGISAVMFLVDDIKANYQKNYYMGRSGNNDCSSRVIFINATTVQVNTTVDVSNTATIRNVYGIKF